MIIIGVDILGNLNKPALSRASLGLSFWRIVIGSGVLIITLGFLNIIAVSYEDPSMEHGPRSTLKSICATRATSSATNPST